MKVWVATVNEVDSECYAEGPALWMSVHASWTGALKALDEYIYSNVFYDEDDEAAHAACEDIVSNGWSQFENGQFEYEARLTEVEVKE